MPKIKKLEDVSFINLMAISNTHSNLFLSFQVLKSSFVKTVLLISSAVRGKTLVNYKDLVIYLKSIVNF